MNTNFIATAIKTKIIMLRPMKWPEKISRKNPPTRAKYIPKIFLSVSKRFQMIIIKKVRLRVVPHKLK